MTVPFYISAISVWLTFSSSLSTFGLVIKLLLLLLYCSIALAQFVEKTIFFHCIAFAPLLKVVWLCLCVSISESSVSIPLICGHQWVSLLHTIHNHAAIQLPWMRGPSVQRPVPGVRLKFGCAHGPCLLWIWLSTCWQSTTPCASQGLTLHFLRFLFKAFSPSRSACISLYLVWSLLWFILASSRV